MMKILLLCFAFSVLLVGACATNPASRSASVEDNAVPEPSLEKIADNVWIHKSHKNVEPWGPILSQGMVVEIDGFVTLVDTAWNNADTEKLLALINTETGRSPEVAIVTHAHQDRMGGSGVLHRAGITVYAHPFTMKDASERGLMAPDHILLSDVRSHLTMDAGPNKNAPVDFFYPGRGHTRDNIVIYYAPAKILFGGCLIRPGDAEGLGNTADADIASWANSVRRVAAEFPDAEIVIPSHGAPGGRELLDHTIALAEAGALAEAANDD